MHVLPNVVEILCYFMRIHFIRLQGIVQAHGVYIVDVRIALPNSLIQPLALHDTYIHLVLTLQRLCIFQVLFDFSAVKLCSVL